MLSHGFKDQVCFSLSLPLGFFLLAKSVFFGGMKEIEVYHNL
jgi:hypothetical protein